MACQLGLRPLIAQGGIRSCWRTVRETGLSPDKYRAFAEGLAELVVSLFNQYAERQRERLAAKMAPAQRRKFASSLAELLPAFTLRLEMYDGACRDRAGTPFGELLIQLGKLDRALRKELDQ